MRGKVGMNALKDHYGSKQRNGVSREHHRRAAGKIIRYCLQQLEEMNLVGQVKYESEEGVAQTMGKTLTKKGYTDMDRIASQLIKDKKKKQ